MVELSGFNACFFYLQQDTSTCVYKYLIRANKIIQQIQQHIDQQ